MLYVDASRYNNTARKTGVENYSFFLINELVRTSPDDITVISPKKIPLDVKQIVIPFPRLWTQIRLSFEVLRNKKIDNLFVPSHVLPLITPKNSTITIHDVAFKRLPESYGFLSRLYLDWAAKFAVKYAKKIIVPSQVTKKDLIDFYKCPSEKIHVIPLGFSAKTTDVNSDEEQKVIGHWELSEGLRRVLRTPTEDIGHYMLYVGRIEHKKNTDTLIKAFCLFAEKIPEIKLVLAGFIGCGGEEILNSIPDNIKDRVIITGYISDEQKHALMQNAMCFVFPSRYEGFGLPLLEAMHYNLPIIASKIPTSYEIAKENALFFEVDDFERLASLMAEITSNEALRAEMVKNHADTLKRYSWENCAKQTLAVLNL